MRELETHFATCTDCRHVAAAARLALGTRPASAPLRRPRTAWEPIGIAASVLLVAALAFWSLRTPLPPAPQAAGRLQSSVQRSGAAPQKLTPPLLRSLPLSPAPPPAVFSPLRSALPSLPDAAPARSPAGLAASAASLNFSTLRSGFQDQQASQSTRGRLAIWGGLTTAQPTLAGAPQVLLPEPSLLDLTTPVPAASLPLSSSFNQASAVTVPLAPQVAASVDWAVSRSGELLHAVAAGIWKSVPLAPGVHVQVLYAQGGQVWAGGAAGELFASSDHGVHWRRVGLPGAITASESLRSIQFSGRNGVITAANRQVWTTSDGGKTWVPR
ncbi:MAG: hypothetical protein ACRD1C_08905 [Terriglobales bacterium]